MAEPDIRVEYVEDEDYFLEAFDRLPRDPLADRWSRLGAAFLACVLMGFAAYRARADFGAGDRLWWLPLAAIPGLCVVVWWWGFSVHARRRAFLRGLRRHLERGIRRGSATFDENGFVSASDDGRSLTHLWSDVPRAIVRADGFFVFIDATTSFWFPRRNFSPAAEAARFEALLARVVPNLQRVEG